MARATGDGVGHLGSGVRGVLARLFADQPREMGGVARQRVTDRHQKSRARFAAPRAPVGRRLSCRGRRQVRLDRAAQRSAPQQLGGRRIAHVEKAGASVR